MVGKAIFLSFSLVSETEIVPLVLKIDILKVFLPYFLRESASVLDMIQHDDSLVPACFLWKIRHNIVTAGH